MSLGPIELLFLPAPLVIVPLGVRVAGTKPRFPLWPAACALAISFGTRRGSVAAALAIPWLVATMALAIVGLRRLCERRAHAWNTAEAAVDAGHLMLPVGAGWAVLSRYGASPLGFEEPLVLLTAVHFHYAAFAAPVVTGAVGRVLGEKGIHRAIAAGVCGGPPLLAAGITLSPLLEAVAAAQLSLALAALAVLVLLQIVPRVSWSG